MDTDSDYKTELFGLSWADRLGVSAPKLIAYGDISDKYLFRYMVLEFISGVTICDVEDKMTDAGQAERDRGFTSFKGTHI